MAHPPALADEQDRLARLEHMQILDTGAEDVFDRLTRLAAAITGRPIALVSLVDQHRQWWKSAVGPLPQGGQTPRQLGRDGREERYTITLTVSVVGNETDAYAVLEARAYAIADLVDASLRAWRSTTPSAFGGVCRWQCCHCDRADWAKVFGGTNSVGAGRHQGCRNRQGVQHQGWHLCDLLCDSREGCAP